METEPNYTAVNTAAFSPFTLALLAVQSRCIEGEEKTYPKNTGHEAADSLGGDFLWGVDIMSLIRGWWHFKYMQWQKDYHYFRRYRIK